MCQPDGLTDKVTAQTPNKLSTGEEKRLLTQVLTVDERAIEPYAPSAVVKEDLTSPTTTHRFLENCARKS